MTVWTLFRSLLPMVLRRQGHYPVFVVLDEQRVRDLVKEGNSLKHILFSGQPWRGDDLWPEPSEEFVTITACKVDY